MNEPTTKVAIVTVNYNTPDLVGQLIDSVKEFTRQVDQRPARLVLARHPLDLGSAEATLHQGPIRV